MRAKANGIPIFNGVEQGYRQNNNRVYVYFKTSIISEAKDWIRKEYGKKFKVKDKILYETSVYSFELDEEMINRQVSEHINERLREVQINDGTNMKKKRSYSEVVKEGKIKKRGKVKENDTISDKYTVITKNVSNKSCDRLEEISEKGKMSI